MISLFAETTTKEAETTMILETESETAEIPASLEVTASISLAQTTTVATPTSSGEPEKPDSEPEAVAAPVNIQAPSEPEGAIGSVDIETEENSITEKPKDPTELLNEQLDMEEISSLLQNMSYSDSKTLV